MALAPTGVIASRTGMCVGTCVCGSYVATAGTKLVWAAKLCS
jgi:hypothetical protein